MLEVLISRGRKAISQLPCRQVMVWVMVFQLASVSSNAQNAPGYVGCFEDDRDRVFGTGPIVSNEQSVEWCFKYCLETPSLAGDYKYAGLEYYDECFCGTNDENLKKHGDAPDSECNDKCEGNMDQICGDGYRLSIYILSQGVCSNDIGPPTNGAHTIINPPSVSYNLNNFKFFRTRVDFSCNTGYTLHGASSIECIETGYNNVTWSDSVPRCEVPRQTTELIASLPATTTLSRTTTGELRATTPTFTSSEKTSRVPEPPPSTRSTTGVAGTNGPREGPLGTGTIIGIAAAGLLTVLVLLLIILMLFRRKRGNKGNKSSDVAMATIGSSYRNNTYGLPENIDQSQPDRGQSGQPVYSKVIREKPTAAQPETHEDIPDQHVYGNVIREKPMADDVYAVPDDVAFQTEHTPDEQQPGDFSTPLASSPNGQETEWVDNTLYGCQSFPVESERSHESGGRRSPETITGQPGWVENIIYE